ncbi:TFIIB-type zinc ribbon-containing protein [Thermococcus sp.]
MGMIKHKYICVKCGGELTTRQLKTLTRCPHCGARWKKSKNKIKGVVKLTTIILEKKERDGRES